MKRKTRFTLLQILVHIGGWVPLAALITDFTANNLTANPIQAIEQRTGLYALTFLVISLACTPVASIFGWKELLQRRKALGNYGFMYAALHMVTFFGIDYGLDLAAVWRDVWNKWYIIIGAVAFLMLSALAFTSFTYWMKRMGKSWKQLHKLVYVISPLVVVHFLLSVKGDITQLKGNIGQPLLYGAIVAVLLIVRIPRVRVALVGLRREFEALVRKGNFVLRPATPEDTPKA